MPLRDELTTIERTLWTNNRQIYDARLEDNALLVFPETGVMRKGAALHGIEEENRRGRRWADVAMGDVEAVALTPDVALLTYRAEARWEDEPASRTVLAASVYVRRDQTWKLAFHQQSIPADGTAATAEPAQAAGTRRPRFTAVAARAAALGAFAIGATALGALAVGRLAIGALAVGRGRVKQLTIEQLHVNTLQIDNAIGDQPGRPS